MHDLLLVVSRLSLDFQSDHVGIYESQERLQATLESVKSLKERSGPMLSKIEGSETFMDQPLVGDLGNFDSIKHRLTDSLINSLEKRCVDVTEGFLEATKIADFSTWPTEYAEMFGNDFVARLSEHFKDTLEKQGVNVQLLLIEWGELKRSLFNSHSVAKLDWAGVNERYRNRCGNILDLIDLILSLPASSSICERGFSLMKLTKTAYRNKMKSSTLSQLLTVKLHTASIEDFHTEPAIKQWFSLKPYRKTRFMEESGNYCATVTSASGSSAAAEPASEDKVAESDSSLSDYESDCSWESDKPDLSDIDSN